MAQELITAAHPQHHRAVICRMAQWVGLVGQVFSDQHLVSILATAQVVEVAVGGDGVADPDFCDFQRQPPPLQAAPEHRDVSPVGVDVQVIRVQMTQPD